MGVIILLALLIISIVILAYDLFHKTADYSGFKDLHSLNRKAIVFVVLYIFAAIGLIPDVWATLLIKNNIATLVCACVIAMNIITYNWIYGYICKIIDKKVDSNLVKPFWYFCSIIFYLLFDGYLIYMVSKLVLNI